MLYKCYKKTIKKEHFENNTNEPDVQAILNDIKASAKSDIQQAIGNKTNDSSQSNIPTAVAQPVNSPKNNNPLENVMGYVTLSNIRLDKLNDPKTLEKYNNMCPIKLDNDINNLKGPRLIKHISNLFLGQMPKTFEDIIDNGTLNFSNEDINYMADFIQQFIELKNECIIQVKDEINIHKDKQTITIGLILESLTKSIQEKWIKHKLLCLYMFDMVQIVPKLIQGFLKFISGLPGMNKISEFKIETKLLSHLLDFLTHIELIICVGISLAIYFFRLSAKNKNDLQNSFITFLKFIKDKVGQPGSLPNLIKKIEPEIIKPELQKMKDVFNGLLIKPFLNSLCTADKICNDFYDNIFNNIGLLLLNAPNKNQFIPFIGTLNLFNNSIGRKRFMKIFNIKYKSLEAIVNMFNDITNVDRSIIKDFKILQNNTNDMDKFQEVGRKMVTNHLEFILENLINTLNAAKGEKEPVSVDGCPKQDCPKQDCPKQDCPKQDCPKQDCPKQDCPKQQCPTPICPKQECPAPVCPKPECPKPECPQPICPKQDTPAPICPKPECPQPVCPKQEVDNKTNYLYIMILLLIVSIIVIFIMKK
jgi:hypothetical protein